MVSSTDGPAAADGRSYGKRLLLGAQGWSMWPWRIRLAMLRAAGLEIAPDAFLEVGIDIIPGRLAVAGGAFIARGCLLDAQGGIAIGRRTLIGSRAVVLTATHAVMPERPRAGPVEYHPVTIGEDAWIGAGALLLPGCVVGDGAVIAAGAVVRGTLAADTLHAGVPATARRRF